MSLLLIHTPLLLLLIHTPLLLLLTGLHDPQGAVGGFPEHQARDNCPAAGRRWWRRVLGQLLERGGLRRPGLHGQYLHLSH